MSEDKPRDFERDLAMLDRLGSHGPYPTYYPLLSFFRDAMLGWPVAIGRMQALAAAIRKHRDESDSRCFLDDYALYEALEEPVPESACQFDQPETMLANCRKYVASRHDPSKPYLCPQEEIDRLRAECDLLLARAETAEAEVARSKDMVDRLGARILAQSELLAKKADEAKARADGPFAS